MTLANQEDLENDNFRLQKLNQDLNDELHFLREDLNNQLSKTTRGNMNNTMHSRKNLQDEDRDRSPARRFYWFTQTKTKII